MERLWSDSRPSVPAAACAPGFAAFPSTAQAYVLGQPAVNVQLHKLAAPMFGHVVTSKINNYMGTTSAKGEGVATSIMRDQKVSAARIQTVQVDKVMGGDARGIPPRGRPV